MVHKYITPYQLSKAFVKAGILTESQVNASTRIVIDSNPARGVVMYVEMVAEKSILDVFASLEGIKIIGVPAQTGTPWSSEEEMLEDYGLSDGGSSAEDSAIPKAAGPGGEKAHPETHAPSPPEQARKQDGQ